MLVIDTNNNISAHIPALKSRGVGAVGRYYSAEAAKRITKAEAGAVASAGLKLFCVFENNGDPALDADLGTTHAQLALQQASSIGQPAGTAIYFALEHLPGGYTDKDIPGVKNYFGQVRAVVGSYYKLGVYSDGIVCDALLSAGLCEYAWLSASMAFAGSQQFYKSGRWALAQKTPIDQDWGGISVDVNESRDDFGQFVPGNAAIVTVAMNDFGSAFKTGAQPLGGAPPNAFALPSAGWVMFVRRLREETRAGEGFARTVGCYQILRDGIPVEQAGGWTVERQGPGNNGEIGHTYHTCIAAGTYPLRLHSTEKYKTIGYVTNGEHPRPAIEVGNTGDRVGILIHPADGYGSTIGCINLSGPLPDTSANILLNDSTARVVAIIESLRVYHNGSLPVSADGSLTNSLLFIADRAK
jgi:Domain of unknown function (DUF1906)